MDYATHTDLKTSVRQEKTATMNASDGLTSDIVDLGVGRSAVGIQIETALAAGSSLTFNGAGGEAESAVAADLDPVRVENSDGSAVASYTILAATSLGYFPLDPAVFNGVRHLQVVSSADNSSKVIKVVSKAV